MMTEEISSAATTMLENGFSVIPVKKNKRSFGSWKEFQVHRMSVDDVAMKFNGATRFATICGEVSGNLENLDIDDTDCREDLIAMIKIKHKNILDKLVFTKTPNGYGIVYRCEALIPGNLKLAMTWDEVAEAGEYNWNDRADLQAREVDGKWIVSAARLETRGEAGYFLTAPSPGYEILEGSFVDLQPITKEDRDSIIKIAKTFDQRPVSQAPEETKPKKDVDTGKKIPWPGDIYNKEADFAGQLMEYGWKRKGKTASGITYSRPGKPGKEGGILYPDGRFMVFSANAAPLEENKQYTAFSMMVVMDFEGDFKAGTKHVAEAGYTVELTTEELTEILEDNPDQLDEAYKRSGMKEAAVSAVATDLGIPLPAGKRLARIEVLYDKLELNRVVEEVDDSLVKVMGDWGYYNYSGQLGYVTDSNNFVGYDTDSLELRAEQSLYMTQWGYENKKPKLEAIRVPVHVLRKIINFPDSSAPKVLGFAQHPVVDVHGDILGLQDGFEKGIMFKKCSGMGFTPDPRTYRECYDRIVELFCGDILFKDREGGEALFVSMLLTGLTRLGLPGGCPGYFITANEPGTGKSTMFEFVSRIIYGRLIESVDWGTDGVERRKEIIACLRDGTECFLFDNIPQGEEVKSPILAQALTSGEFKSRVMGKGEMVYIQAQSLFVFIGNNLNMATELTRRLMTVKLMAREQNPARRNVEIKNVAQYCEDCRVEVIGCLLKMLQEGFEMEEKIEHGSGFTFWDKVVRNPLLLKTGIDIARGFEDSEDESAETGELEDVIQLVVNVFGVGKRFTTRELFLAITDEKFLGDDELKMAGEIRKGAEEECRLLRDALLMRNGVADKSIKSLGKVLSSLSDRVVDDYRFVRHKTKSKKPVKHWVEFVGEESTTP